MTQEKIETIFARLDRLGLDDPDVNKDEVDPQESMRRVDLFMSVLLVPHLILNQLLSSALGKIKQKLQAVYDRIQAEDYTGNEGDAQIVSELMDDIRDAVTDYQVNGLLECSCDSPLRQPV